VNGLEGFEQELERARRDPLTSPALATASDDLIQSCPIQEPKPARPPAADGTPLALAFSGGGFRAALAALGVLRFLADAGLLQRIRYASSVSGGSIANGLFAHHYGGLEERNFSPQALDEIVIEPLIEQISSQSLSTKLIRNGWRIIGPRTRTHLLADIFDSWFFDGHRLQQLPAGCRFIFNAANLTTGVRFGFERDVFGDYVLGRRTTAASDLRLATAVAASAAVPGAFAPLVLDQFDFPCANGRVAKLVDGGAYDNAGLEPVDDLPEAFLVALNAGGLFRTGHVGGLPVIRTLTRSNAILYRQSTGLRRREMVSRFQAFEKARAQGQANPDWGRQGILFGLATTFDEPNPEWTTDRPDHDELRIKLALVKTSFADFPRTLCHQLIYRGWWLTGCSIATYHRAFVGELPHWRPLVGESAGA
jgi:NTE family protein